MVSGNNPRQPAQEDGFDEVMGKRLEAFIGKEFRAATEDLLKFISHEVGTLRTDIRAFGAAASADFAEIRAGIVEAQARVAQVRDSLSLDDRTSSGLNEVFEKPSGGPQEPVKGFKHYGPGDDPWGLVPTRHSGPDTRGSRVGLSRSPFGN